MKEGMEKRDNKQKDRRDADTWREIHRRENMRVKRRVQKKRGRGREWVGRG